MVSVSVAPTLTLTVHTMMDDWVPMERVGSEDDCSPDDRTYMS